MFPNLVRFYSLGSAQRRGVAVKRETEDWGAVPGEQFVPGSGSVDGGINKQTAAVGRERRGHIVSGRGPKEPLAAAAGAEMDRFWL